MTRPGRGSRLVTLAVSCALLGISCGDPTSPDHTDVDRVEVNPAAVALTVGETRTITAQVFDANDERIVDRRVFWTSQNPTVATVSQSGVVTGTGSGNTQIAASAGGKSGLVAVSVNARPVSLVRVIPPLASVQTGRTVTLAAEAVDASGAEVVGRPVAWKTSNAATATVSATGVVSGVTPGTVTITATIDGIDGTASVTVSAVPATSVRITPGTGTVVQGDALQLTATPLDAQGNSLGVRPATWSSSDESIATVSSTGRVVGIAEGSFTITARIDGVSGTGVYTVSRIPVGKVTVSPATSTLSVGGTQQMTLTLLAADQTTPLPLAGRTIVWSSSNVAVVSVNTTGLVSGVSSGSATITATTEGISGTATVNVTAVPISSITVTPPTASVVEGSTVTLTGTARDAGNGVLAGRTLFWASSNPLVSVSQTGVVTAVLPSGGQSATITASAPGGGPGGTTPSGSANVTVTYAPVASVTLTPTPQTINVAQTTTFVMTLRTAGGQTLPAAGRTVSWRSLNPALVSVNATTGVVTGVAQGGPVGIEVTVASPGQSTPAVGMGTVTVANVPVASVTVSPNPATVFLGAAYSQTFTAVTRDAANNVLTGRSIVWTSLDQSVATVNSITGVVTGVGTGGPVTIRATSEGVNGDAAVTVSLVPVATVTVTPASATLSASQPTQSLTATPRDASGNPITGAALGGRTTGWQSSDVNVATVSTSGLVTAVGAGSATITATIGGTPGTSAIMVVVPVANVAFTAAPDSLILPGSVSGQVTVTDASNNLLQGRTVTFGGAPAGLVSMSPSPGTTNASGQLAVTITGVAAGTATVTATSEGKTDDVVVRVLAGISNIAFSPPADSVFLGSTLALTATATGSTGALAGRPLTISSSNPGAATASPSTPTNTNGSGQVGITVTAVAPGSTTLSASGETVTASRVINVLAPAHSVDVSPTTASLVEGDLRTFTAVVKDASGNTLTGRVVSWSSSNPGVLSINASTGVATALDGGSSTVTASVSPGTGGTPATGTASVTVTLQPVVSVVITPSTVTVPSGTNSTVVTVEARLAGGLPAPNRSCTVSSSNGFIASVNPTSGTTDSNGNLSITVSRVLLPGTVTIAGSCAGVAATTSAVTFQ